MLRLDSVWFGFEEEYLFEDLSCAVHAGQKVGLVGRNGIGKSTLFKLIRQRLIPEEGNISLPEKWHVSWLRQDVPVSEKPAIEFVMDGHQSLRRIESRMKQAQETQNIHEYGQLHDEFEALGGYQAEARAGMILSGLSFESSDFQSPYSSFSGGWRIRLNLAQTLNQPSDLMLLDEPTNHLDLEALVWLQRWIRRYPGTLVCISHDREFLDRSVDSILHLEQRQATLYRGSYSSFERQRAERLELQTRTYAQQEKERKRVQRFIDRFRTYASKAKQVQSRIKSLERMTLTAPLRALSPYSFRLQGPEQLDRPMLSIDDGVFGYGEKTVLSQVTERIYPGDRIALLGVNGAGKSTLLKVLAGELEPLEGERTVGLHTTIGYFAQHQLEQLDASVSAHDHVAASGLEATQEIRNYLGQWGFSGDDIFRPVSSFSGGEKARLVIALIARHQPAILILDEPTNHLDLEMREALNVALREYEGAVLLVSHDQHLLRQSANEFWLVSQGKVKHFDGDLDDYEDIVVQMQQEIESSKPRKTRTSRKDLRRQRADERNSNLEASRRRAKLEAQISSARAELTELSVVLNDPNSLNSLDNKKLQRNMSTYGRKKKEIERLEKQWLDLVDQE